MRQSLAPDKDAGGSPAGRSRRASAQSRSGVSLPSAKTTRQLAADRRRAAFSSGGLQSSWAVEARRRELLSSADSAASSRSGSRPGSRGDALRRAGGHASAPELLVPGDLPALSRGSLQQVSLSDPKAKADKLSVAVHAPVSRSLRRSEPVLRMAEKPSISQPWNELLRDTVTRRDPNVLQDFWREVKSHIIFRFAMLPCAWREIDPDESGFISFPTFSSFMRLIGVDLDQRAARGIFSDIAKGGVHLNLKEFECILMKGTVKKLQNAMMGFHKNRQAVQDHVQRFIEYLNHVDEPRQIMAVDRFQRKLSVQFCSDVFRKITEHLLGSIEDATVDHSKACIDRLAFSRCLRNMVLQHKLFAYESYYMQCIFDRINTLKDKSLPVVDLVTALVLLSPDNDRRRKLALVFQVFDTDCDDCLLYDQVMAMILCVSMQNSVAANTVMNSKLSKRGGLVFQEEVFQEELSFQEGQRTYECVRWHLEHVLGIRDVVNFQEVWQSLEALPGALYTLIPGSYKLSWLSEIVREDRLLAKSRETKHDLSSSLTSLPAMASQQGFRPSTGTSTGTSFRPGSTGTSFAKTVTTRFRKSLRDSGNQRLQDLSITLRAGARPEAELEARLEAARQRRCLLPRDRDRLPSYPLPPPTCTWGSGSAHRYKLFEQAKLSGHWSELCSHGMVCYACQLCSSNHVLLTGEDA